MPGEDEARVGLSAQLATTALTTTTTSSGGSASSSLASSAGLAGASSSSSSSVTAATGGGGAATSSSLLSSTSSSIGGGTVGLPKVPLPALAAHSYGGSRGGGLGVGSGLLSGIGLNNSNNQQQGVFPTAAPTLTPIAIASYSPGNNSTVTTVNNNFTPGATTTTITTNNSSGAGILSNINNPGFAVDGGLLNNKKQQQQQQSFQNNPLNGAGVTRPPPLLANINNQNSSSAASLVNSYNKQPQHHHQYPLHQYQPQPQLSLKPIIATPNGNPSSAPLAETNKRDTGTHGRHHGGGGSIDDDEIDEAGDSSKLELSLQFAGIDNETAVDVDVEDEENNFEAGIESGPMCTVVPTSKRNGGGSSSNNGGGGEKSGGGGQQPSSSFPGGGGDVPSAGSGTMVVASSAAAAGSAAPATSTTSSATLGGGAGGVGGAETGPTNNSLAVPGTTTSGPGGGGSILGDEEEDEEEDVEGGKTAECTEVVVPIQSFAEKCLFYTTAFFILLAVFSLFAFLFLVPFVIDPAFTTIFMEFDPEPAFCQTVSFEQKEGLSNCTWTSCREGCTREVYQCKQIRVNYRSARKSHSPDSNSNNNNNNADSSQQQETPPQQLRRPNNHNNLYIVVCSDFVDKYGKEGTNFSCYYSKVDRALVVTQYDMSRVIMDLIYSMAIPIPSFIISVVYLIFAYFRIYNTDSSSPNETGGGGRAERLNSSSTTTNLQNPGSANRGGGGSSADDPDAETSLSVDDKTCIIQRSTSGGLNALSNKLPNSGKGLHAQVIEMNDLNPMLKVNATNDLNLDAKLRHPVDGDVFLPQKRNNNCSNNPANPERNGPTNPAAKNKGEDEETSSSATPAVEAS